MITGEKRESDKNTKAKIEENVTEMIIPTIMAGFALFLSYNTVHWKAVYTASVRSLNFNTNTCTTLTSQVKIY